VYSKEGIIHKERRPNERKMIWKRNKNTRLLKSKKAESTKETRKKRETNKETDNETKQRKRQMER
jgi:hypothetical protein